MHVSLSNAKLVFVFAILRIVMNLALSFMPYPWVYSGSVFSFRNDPYTYLSYSVHILPEILFCVIYLYIIALLKTIGAAKFIVFAYYANLIVAVFSFLFFFLMTFITSYRMAYYEVVGVLTLITTVYLFIATFWVKKSLLRAPFIWHASCLIFIFGFQIIFPYIASKLIQSSNMLLFYSSTYRYISSIVGTIPGIAITYAVYKSQRLFDFGPMPEVEFKEQIYF